ncbi:MAG: methyltransferase domain-containing protein [Deltaproteobacteria bacterium]|nr:methyltransferase domain-containing protein [Deltaproteobacteria bacterium]
MKRRKIDWRPQAYDAWYETPLGRLSGRLEKELVFSLAGVKQAEAALDLGCGTGIYSIELAKRGMDVTGVDDSQEMLDRARIKAKAEGVRIRFLKADAMALPFPDASFDIVLSVAALCFMEDPHAALMEMRRVLRPGGRVVIGSLNRWSLWALVRRVKGLFRETIYNRAVFTTPRELESALARAGFEGVKVRACIFFLPVNSALYLKTSAAHERLGNALAPWTGAFLAAVAAKRLD